MVGGGGGHLTGYFPLRAVSSAIVNLQPGAEGVTWKQCSGSIEAFWTPDADIVD